MKHMNFIKFNKCNTSTPLFNSHKSIKEKLILVTNENQGKYINCKKPQTTEQHNTELQQNKHKHT